jgi:hypothetical protein
MRTLIFLSGLLAVTALHGQSLLRPNLYVLDMQYYNPAAIPLSDGQAYGLALMTKSKFVENDAAIWDKPTNVIFNYAGRIKTTEAFGTLNYTYDSYSFYTRHAVSAGYTRRARWGEHGTFAYGGRLVLNLDGVNWDDFELPSGESGRALKANADADIGVAYASRSLRIGLSVRNLLDTRVRLDDQDLLANHRTLYLDGAYTFRFGEDFGLTPFVLLYLERNAGADAGLSLRMFDRINVSYALRVTELRSIYALEADLTRAFSLGVAYDHASLMPDTHLDAVMRFRF